MSQKQEEEEWGGGGARSDDGLEAAPQVGDSGELDAHVYATLARARRGLELRNKGWLWAQPSAHLGNARGQVHQEIHIGEACDPKTYKDDHGDPGGWRWRDMADPDGKGEPTGGGLLGGHE